MNLNRAEYSTYLELRWSNVYAVVVIVVRIDVIVLQLVWDWGVVIVVEYEKYK